MSSTEEEVEVGFEIAGDFYRWSVSDSAKDLMLIDKFTQMPAQQFFELIEDNFDRGRGPILLAMMACSVRRANPDWSVERIGRMILALSLNEVTFVGAEGEGEKVDVATPLEEKKAKKVKEESSDSSSEKQSGHSESAV